MLPFFAGIARHGLLRHRILMALAFFNMTSSSMPVSLCSPIHPATRCTQSTHATGNFSAEYRSFELRRKAAFRSAVERIEIEVMMFNV
jgi:hypothetical protein